MKCNFCGNTCVKDGHQSDGTQRYRCQHCHKRQQATYQYNAYSPDTDSQIISLTKIGVGIRDTAKFLKISTTTLLKRILSIAGGVKMPRISMKHRYEVDEMWSFIGNKQHPVWIAYALDRNTRQVVSFNTGRRSSEMLEPIITTLNNSSALRIYTDKFPGYRRLIAPAIHTCSKIETNHIERHNLTLRTHLKRLTRKTICFSRNIAILTAILKIYFWG